MLVAAYLVAAVVAIVAQRVSPVPQWLALHLLLLGAATNAVFVWSRHFAQAFLHVRAEHEGRAHARLVVLNVGVVAVLAGVAGTSSAAVVAGAVLVIAAVVAHVASLVALLRGASYAGWLRVAVRYYVAGGAALVIGAGLGAALGAHAVHSRAFGRALVLAHAHVDLLGWLGLSVIGTQFMLWPAVMRTRMDGQPTALVRRVLVGTTVGLALAVAGLLLSPTFGAMRYLAACGVALYAAADACALWPAVKWLLAGRARSASAWALLLGNAWLIIALVLDVVALARGIDAANALLHHVLVVLLGLGMVAQILTGSLAFLLPVTVGGGPVGNRMMASVLDFGWPLRAALANAGVVILAVAREPSWRAVGWAGVIAGFGSFPVLIVVALVAVRALPSRTHRPPASG